MDSVGRFHVEEVDGKRSFVYSSMTFSTDSGESNGLLSQPLFLCPTSRLESFDEIMKLDTPPQFHGVAQKIDDYERLDRFNHHVLPLFPCNWFDICGACGGDSKVTSGFYFCGKCRQTYHKECIESPLEINHPLHPKHPLQLCYGEDSVNCFHCRKSTHKIGYQCTLCKFRMHPVCAVEPVSCVIDQCKRHEHSLTFFTRKQVSLDCNVCGLISGSCSTYVCLQCNFVAHRDCADSPHVIRISRHQHRICFSLSLPLGNQSCGVCRKEVNREYGGYTCNKSEGYVVHSRCALRKDVWDGEELVGVPEEDDMEEIVEPFERISDGIILHFSHKHLLRLEISRVYDESKICEACVIPIYEGDFYSCEECSFILHDTCANAPTIKRHPLHPHPLTLKVVNGNDDHGYFVCVACQFKGSGFIYKCKKKGCRFKLDVRCAFISEPFDYLGHEHPLFLAIDPAGEKKSCQVCKSTYNSLLNCVECDYIICFKCVTIPYMARYKHDKHFLTLGYGDRTSKPDWCEVCEKQLPSNQEGKFYTCDHCCTTLHITCLLGKDRYMKPGHTINHWQQGDIKILPNNSLSRPTCDFCESRCVNKTILRGHKNIWCSIAHVRLGIRRQEE